MSSPIMMDIETRKNETERYFKSISLDKIKNREKDQDWWYATRAMCAFTLVVAEFTCMNLEASDKLVSEIKKSAPLATELPLFVRVKLFISNSI